MNRLVLIGNGFDLAHGLKTSYADFINWYWEQWEKRLMGHPKALEEDELCSFKMNDIGLGGWYLVKGYRYSIFEKDIINKIKQDKELCEFKYKSPFFEQINRSIETKGWADIENEYYMQLVCVKDVGNGYQTLNRQLDYLCKRLIEYLREESKKDINVIEDIRKKIYCPIKRHEIVVSKYLLPENDYFVLSKIMLLNFNYTETPQRYIEDSSKATITNIHGQLKHPSSVIFGYGDELDKEYNRLKEQNDNECLRYVKAINYLESDNYRKVLEFIESEPFQICIMGHSCGNSDRTLLNTLFEHPNCVSIKPYYYINDKRDDNYRELVQNIHRNFTDMKSYRDKVVNKDYCEPLVGVKPGVIVMG